MAHFNPALGNFMILSDIHDFNRTTYEFLHQTSPPNRNIRLYTNHYMQTNVLYSTGKKLLLKVRVHSPFQQELKLLPGITQRSDYLKITINIRKLADPLKGTYAVALSLMYEQNGSTTKPALAEARKRASTKS
ncbi:hypothetical protein [Paenibacillus filicis]|uniref:hypothetical protein n=1 Tax=Paenibacillus filicis TaxID=669464 RepID=UPI003119E79F